MVGLAGLVWLAGLVGVDGVVGVVGVGVKKKEVMESLNKFYAQCQGRYHLHKYT